MLIIPEHINLLDIRSGLPASNRSVSASLKPEALQAALGGHCSGARSQLAEESELAPDKGIALCLAFYCGVANCLANINLLHVQGSGQVLVSENPSTALRTAEILKDERMLPKLGIDLVPNDARVGCLA
tara:strand:- start:89 stop:475 length:387 start_codon:yes stop_codon:yes gene_type:complete